MMRMSEIAQVVQGKFLGGDLTIEAVSIDGRKIATQGLFVALKGEHVDGHDFIDQAIKQGAVAALVEREMSVTVPIVIVENVRRALADLATYWRAKFAGKVIAVTGSNGKTTVKEMLASIMSGCGATVATQGNLNNDLGVPLTLLRIRPQEHKYAVIEMGANHVGEIKQLCQMAGPDVSLINNVGMAHLEGFGSVNDIVTAKSEIYAGLRPGGTAIINADDNYKETFIKNSKPHQYVLFSAERDADVMGQFLGFSANGMLQLRLTTQTEKTDVLLPLLGKHNVMNALAAATTALAAGATLKNVKQGLERIKPVPGRLNVKPGLGETIVIDDTYNANPSSCAVALDALASFAKKKILVLGDMGELGVDAQALHADVGRMAREKGVDSIYTLGALSQSAAVVFSAQNAFCFLDCDALIKTLLNQITTGVLKNRVILIKGSRFMKMERVVNAITEGVTSSDNGDVTVNSPTLMMSK